MTTNTNPTNVNKGDVVTGVTELGREVKGVVKMLDGSTAWLDTTLYGGDPLAWAPVGLDTVEALEDEALIAVPAAVRIIGVAAKDGEVLEAGARFRETSAGPVVVTGIIEDGRVVGILEDDLEALRELAGRDVKPVAGGSNELDRLPVHRGAKLAGFSVGRCMTHGGFTFRGEGITLEVATCPVCGDSLAATTSSLKSGFRVIDGSKGTEAEAGIVRAMMAPALAAAVEDRVAKAVAAAERHNEAIDRIERREAGVTVWTGSRFISGLLEPARAWSVAEGRYGGRTYDARSKASTETTIERELKAARKFARKAKALGVAVIDVPASLELKDVPELPERLEELELAIAAERLNLERAKANVAEMQRRAGDRVQYVGMYQRDADRAAERLEELKGELEAAAEVERRGLKPAAGGSPELDDLPAGYSLRRVAPVSAAAARRTPASHWRRELEVLLALGAGERWVGSNQGSPFSGGEANSLAARGALLIAEQPNKPNGIKRYRLTDHGIRAAGGDPRNPRLSALRARAAAGDGAAAAAARAYRTDAELEAAEALSKAQDYTDGGGPIDADGRPPAE